MKEWQKKTSIDFIKIKKEGEQVAWITTYDFPTASFVEQAGMDMIFVADSLGMVVLGYQGTIPVIMEDCISHCQVIRWRALNNFFIGDMPFMPYQISDQEATRNAGRFLKEFDMDAVKLEGGLRVCNKIKAIADAGILV